MSGTATSDDLHSLLRTWRTRRLGYDPENPLPQAIAWMADHSVAEMAALLVGLAQRGAPTPRHLEALICRYGLGPMPMRMDELGFHLSDASGKTPIKRTWVSGLIKQTRIGMADALRHGFGYGNHAYQPSSAGTDFTSPTGRPRDLRIPAIKLDSPERIRTFRQALLGAWAQVNETQLGRELETALLILERRYPEITDRVFPLEREPLPNWKEWRLLRMAEMAVAMNADPSPQVVRGAQLGPSTTSDIVAVRSVPDSFSALLVHPLNGQDNRDLIAPALEFAACLWREHRAEAREAAAVVLRALHSRPQPDPELAARVLCLNLSMAREREDIAGLTMADMIRAYVGPAHPLSQSAAIDASIICSAHANFDVSRDVLDRAIRALDTDWIHDRRERDEWAQQLRLALSGTYLRWARVDSRMITRARLRAHDALEEAEELGLDDGFMAACFRRVAEIELVPVVASEQEVQRSAAGSANRWLTRGQDTFDVYSLSDHWMFQWALAAMTVYVFLPGREQQFLEMRTEAVQYWSKTRMIPNLGKKLAELNRIAEVKRQIPPEEVVPPRPETGWSNDFNPPPRGPRQDWTRHSVGRAITAR